MGLINGATYRFVNRADGARSLNVYGTSPASLANVCLWSSSDTDICQQWIYKEEGSNKYLQCKGNTNLVLDLFTGSSTTANVKNYNAQVYAKSSTSYIEIEEATGDYIKIKLLYNGRYLTANQNSNGTSSGKSVNSAGNVYFYNGGLTDYSQDWLPVLLDAGTGGNEGSGGDEETGGGTGETSDYPEGYYRFSQSTYCLNGTTSALTAVTCNGEKNQTWRYKNGKLYVEANSTYGISGTSTPKMSASPVEIVLEYKTEHTCNIKLKGTDKYLYRSGSTISWSTTEDPWVIERIIKKTGTPRYNPEYFSAMCGETDGSWDGERTDNLKSLFSKIYKNHTGTVADSNIGACLYGAMYGNVAGVKGKFHTGVDINDGSAYNVYEISSPISGYIVNANQSNGSVCVYNNEAGNDYTVVFMHMEIDPDIERIASTTCNQNNWINADAVLGKQSGYSGGNATTYASHLHIEIHEGKYTGNGAGLPSKSYEALGGTVSPYGYFADIINS